MSYPYYYKHALTVVRASQVGSDIAGHPILRKGFLIGGGVVGLGYMAINIVLVSSICLRQV